MFGKKLPKQRAGRPIASRTLNLSLEELSRQSKLSASAPLKIVDTATGPVLCDTSEVPFWIKLTSGSGAGPFAWTKQYSSGAGTWANAVQVGTVSVDPAYNGISGVTLPTLPIIVLAQRSDDGTLVFFGGSC